MDSPGCATRCQMATNKATIFGGIFGPKCVNCQRHFQRSTVLVLQKVIEQRSLKNASTTDVHCSQVRVDSKPLREARTHWITSRLEMPRTRTDFQNHQNAKSNRITLLYRQHSARLSPMSNRSMVNCHRTSV